MGGFTKQNVGICPVGMVPKLPSFFYCLLRYVPVNGGGM